MAGRQEPYPGIDDLAARRAALAELLRQLEARSDGASTSEERRLRGELTQLDREMRIVAGAA
jgi:hypothetical protein